MNKQPRHNDKARRLVRLGLPVFLGLAAIATAAPANAASSTFSTQPAAKVVEAARAAMLASGSVEAVGSGHLSLPGGGSAVAAETNYSGPTSGTQTVAVTAEGATSSSELPAASISLLDGALYVDANAAFWTDSVGLSAAESPTVAGRWVEIPASSAIYAATAADMSMPSLVKDMFDAKEFDAHTVKELDGVKVVPVSYTNRGYDSGPATVYVAVGGKHRPVSATISGVSLRFAGWGSTRAVVPPAGAVPLSSLLPSVSSSTPILA